MSNENWIPVSEKTMPRKGQRVIVYSPQLGVLSAVLHLNINGKWKYTGVDMPIHYSNAITHWQPLPEPPIIKP